VVLVPPIVLIPVVVVIVVEMELRISVNVAERVVWDIETLNVVDILRLVETSITVLVDKNVTTVDVRGAEVIVVLKNKVEPSTFIGVHEQTPKLLTGPSNDSRGSPAVNGIGLSNPHSVNIRESDSSNAGSSPTVANTPVNVLEI
jgi:hypothetical protein